MDDQPSTETTITDQVRFGLDAINVERSVQVPLRDMLFAYKLLGELYMFFRRGENFRDVAAVQSFIGDDSRGALQLLREAYYERFTSVFPDDIEMALSDHDLQCPNHPPYCRP